MQEVEGTVFGRSVKLPLRVIQQLDELEQTGAMTVRFADTPADENEQAHFGLYRIKFTPREIYDYVDAVIGDKGLSVDLEALVCGLTPWRYEKLDERTVYAHGWDDDEPPKGPLGVVD